MQIEDQPKDSRSPGFSVAIAETICERLINGESLRATCADPRMPAKATVFRWLASNQEFRRSSGDVVEDGHLLGASYIAGDGAPPFAGLYGDVGHERFQVLILKLDVAPADLRSPPCRPGGIGFFGWLLSITPIWCCL